MRRRPIILLLCATAALVGAAIALADAPATSPAVKALAETPDAQLGPAIAVNPAGGLPNISAIALGTDWRGGSGNPQSVFATGAIVGATGATTWVQPPTILPHTSGVDVGGGSPDVTWGPGNKVYAVELGRDTSAPLNPCATGAGLYFLASSNGGASWGTPIQIVNNSPTVAVSEPSIAYSPVTGRISISYTKTDPCSGGAAATSTVRFMSMPNDVGTGFITNITASPTGLRFAHSSIAVLPNGRVGIAYYNASQSPGSVQVTTCAPSTGVITSAPVCSPDAPVTVDPSASAPGNTILGLDVDVRPRIAADPMGRVIVAWAKQTLTNNMDVFTATSRNAGVTFGSPQLVPADLGTANQIDPTIAITAGGRADVAFLDTRWDSTAFRVAVSASNPPIGFGTSESWTQSVLVESTPIAPVRPTVPGTPSLGAKIAIAEIPRTPDTAWTLVAWTDTRNVSVGTAPLNEDVYSTVLLHGTTAPVGVDTAPPPVQRNVTTPIALIANDADADPLTYTIMQDGTLGQATITDPNKPQFNYTAGGTLGTDQVKVQISDGQQTTTATTTLQVVNTPPQIACSLLTTKVDTPLPIPTSCVSDANGDTVSLDASSPQHGAIQRPGGVLTFVPSTGFDGLAQVTLVASDGIDSATRTVNIQVGDPGVTPVIIAGARARAAFTNRPITLTATPTVSGADASKISWSFDGAPPTDQGPTVSHLFTKARIYTVTARVGSGPVDTVKVYVQKPLLSLKGTDLTQGVMGLRVQLATAGKLTVGLLGIPGTHRTVKLKRGAHTLHMKLPLSARTRGTVIVKLGLKVANGATAKMKRAVLLPAP